MSVLAFVASIRADPIETIQVLLNSIDKALARDDCIGYFARLRSRVLVDIDTCLLLLLNRQVVRILALLSLFTNASFEVAAKRVFVVDF